MKKFLLLLAVVCILAPVEMASAATKANTFGSFISSIFGKKEKPQPKFRPMPKSVFKIK